MGRFFGWIYRAVVFYLKFFVFLGVFALLVVYGVIHAALFGGPIMPDDAWFLAKVLFLILLPVVLSLSLKGKAPLFIGLAASLLLACFPGAPIRMPRNFGRRSCIRSKTASWWCPRGTANSSCATAGISGMRG